MQTLYVTDQGAQVHRNGQLLRIERGGLCLARVAPQGLDHTFPFGNVSLTAPALRLLLERDVNVGACPQNPQASPPT